MLCTISKIEKHRNELQNLVDDLEISELQKIILKKRYVNLVYCLHARAAKYSLLYHLGHFIITVGSLFVPALLSVQYTNTDGESINPKRQVDIFWTTWVISLLVTISNGIITLYKIDKKYYVLYTVLERLRSEGWQYFSLTGRYSGHLIDHQIPTHTNQFVYFCYYIEKIALKLVAEEYLKQDEKSLQNTNGANASSATNINSITEQSKNNYSVSSMPEPDNTIKKRQKPSYNMNRQQINTRPRSVSKVIGSIIKSRTHIDSFTNQSQNSIIEQKINDKDYEEIDIEDNTLTETLSLYSDNTQKTDKPSAENQIKNPDTDTDADADTESEVVSKTEMSPKRIPSTE